MCVLSGTYCKQLVKNDPYLYVLILFSRSASELSGVSDLPHRFIYTRISISKLLKALPI